MFLSTIQLSKKLVICAVRYAAQSDFYIICMNVIMGLFVPRINTQYIVLTFII